MLNIVMKDQTLDKLVNTTFAKELTAYQCASLASIMTIKHLSRGQFLLRDGNRDDTLYIVTRGTLAVVKQFNGHEEILSQIKEGGLAGAMGFIDGQEHSAGLRAENETEVLALPRKELEKLLMDDAQLSYSVMRAIIRSVHGIVRAMNDQYMQLTNYITKQHGRY